MAAITSASREVIPAGYSTSSKTLYFYNTQYEGGGLRHRNQFDNRRDAGAARGKSSCPTP